MSVHPPRPVSGPRDGCASACAQTVRRPVPSGVAGFTLIEITIAAALFAFVAFVTAEYYPLAGLNAQAGRNTSFAARFAQECIEDMKPKSPTYLNVTASNPNPYLCLNTNQGNFNAGNVPSNQITATAANVQYTLSISATSCAGVNTTPCNFPTATGAGNPSLTLITVVVTWTEPSNPGGGGGPLLTRTYTVITMRHNFF